LTAPPWNVLKHPINPAREHGGALLAPTEVWGNIPAAGTFFCILSFKIKGHFWFYLCNVSRALNGGWGLWLLAGS